MFCVLYIFCDPTLFALWSLFCQISFYRHLLQILPLLNLLVSFNAQNERVWILPVSGCGIHFLITLQVLGTDDIEESELSVRLRAETRGDMEK